MTAKITNNKPDVPCSHKNQNTNLISNQEIKNTFLDNANDLIQSVYPDGTIFYANKKWLEMLGYKKEELPALNIFDILREDQIPHCSDLFERIKKGEKLEHIETVFKAKDGREIWVEGNIDGCFEDGNFISTSGIFRDISRRKSIECALDEAQKSYFTLFNSAGDAIYIADMQNKMLEANDAACKLFGYSKTELKNKDIKELASPRFVQNYDQVIQDLIEKGDIVCEAEALHQSGGVIPIELHSRVIEYKGGKAVLVILRDISDRKELELMHKKTEARLESMVKISQTSFKNSQELLDFTLEEVIKLTESKSGYIYSYDAQRKEFSLTSCSRDLREIYAGTIQQTIFLIDQTDLIGETIRQRKEIVVNKPQNPDTLKNGYPPNNSTLTRCLIIPILRGENIAAVISVANRQEDYSDADVTQIQVLMDSAWNLFEHKYMEEERHKTTEKLQNSEEQYRQVFDLSQNGILTYGENGTILMANPAACKIFGYANGELVGLSIVQTFPPEERQSILALVQSGEARTAKRFERQALQKNGKLIPIEGSVSPLHKGHFQEIIQDISERKKAEEDLKTQKENFLKVFQLNPAMMSIVSTVDSRFLGVNKAFETETGYSAAEIIGSSSKDRRIYKNPVIMSYIENLLHEQGFAKNVEIPLTTKSGLTFTGLISVEVIEMDGESAAISVIENITERKQILEQITTEKNKLQSITDSLGDGLNIVDLDYNIIYQNDSSISNIGQHLGEKCHRVFTNSSEICNICPVRMALEDGKKHVVETNVTFPDGKNLISEVTASCIRDANGKITSFVELVRDITSRRQAEIKLIESEEFNSTLLRNSPSPILVINPDSSIKYINPALVQLTGFKEDQIIGLKAPYPWYPEENKLQYSSEILSALNRGVIRAERQYQKMDGERFWVQVSATSVQSKGKANYTIATWNDITENKIMEESLRVSESNFRNLIENAPLGISVGTVKGTIIITNKTMLDVYGCETELEFRIKPISERYVNPEDRESFLNRLLKEGLVKNFEVPMKRKNGEIFWTSTNAIYQKFGHTDCIITIVEDITERKLAKDNLEKANKQLIELDKLKDNFLSTVSHELRTPLTSIKSFAEILLNYDEDRATQKEFLGIINEESDRLSRLINDFLDLSKIQAGRMQWQTTDIALPEVMQTAKNTLKPLLEKNQLELTVDLEPDLPLVRSDKDKLLQVFTNLLGNAIKFTPEGGKINVKARLQNASENTENKEVVEVRVTDTGIGIAPEHYLSIFEKFGQVGDVLKDRPKGTGLGLPICKKIIENYGGKIWVESVFGKGSTFIFTLNIAPSSKINTSGSQTQGLRISLSTVETNKSKMVLVVDDEPNIRRFIKHELSNRGHDVIEASGGKEAVDLARKFHPDLITLDITMPDINGFDVTAVLKNDPQTKDIPILIISVIEDKQKAYRLGANDYITKPISIDLLMKRVDYLLEANQKTILAVDDDAAITRSLEFELHKRGYTVYTAANGKEGLISVQENHPSLIILDLKMPLMDGYEMLKTLKSKPDTQGIPVILLTGVEIDGGRVNALSIGASEYIKKSEGFNKLFEAVERISGSQKP